MARLEEIESRLRALEATDVAPEIRAQLQELLALSESIKTQSQQPVEDMQISTAEAPAPSEDVIAKEKKWQIFVLNSVQLSYLLTEWAENPYPGFIYHAEKLPHGPVELRSPKSNIALRAELAESELVYTAQLNNAFPDTIRKALWPKKRRLYRAAMEHAHTVELANGAQLEAQINALDGGQKAKLQFIVYAATILGDKIERLKSQARRFMKLSTAEEMLLAKGLDAAQSLYAHLVPMLAAKADPSLPQNPFDLAIKLAEGLKELDIPPASELGRLIAKVNGGLSAFNEASTLFEDGVYGAEEVIKAAEPKGALLTLKVPDPEFNLKRLAADLPTGLLSRMPRKVRVGVSQFLINEMAPRKYPNSFIWAVVTFEDSIPFASMADIPEGILAGIDEFSREEFSTEKNIFYLPLKLISKYPEPLELKEPLISRRYGPMIEIPSDLKKEECLACGGTSSFEHCPSCYARLQKAGPSNRYAPIQPGRGPDLDPLPLDEVLSHFHPEFVLRAPFIHLVGSTVNNGETKHDVDILIKGPLDPETEHIVKFRLGRMLPSHISNRVQYLGGEQATGPFTAHTALYDLVVRRRDDFETIIEMQAENIAKQDPYTDMPSKGDVAYPAVLQAHFRGRTVHGDFRIQRNGDLIGYTMSIQKMGKVPDVKALPQAKSIAHSFDMRGSWWNKAINAPSRVFAALKQLHPLEWLNIEGEEFDPGTVGGTRFKPGFIVTMAKPKVTFGTQTPFFHEYFLEGDPKFQGILTFRLVPRDGAQPEQGPALSGAFWTGMFTKSLLPSVLKKRALDVGRIPPQGFSALPPAIKAAVPERFQYWKAADEKERIQIRDALIAEELFTEKNIKLVDGKIQPLLTKLYTYDNKELDEAPALPGSRQFPAQLFPTPAWLAKAASFAWSLYPEHSKFMDPFFDYNGGAFAVSNSQVDAACALNVASEELTVDLQRSLWDDAANLGPAILTGAEAAERLHEASSWRRGDSPGAVQDLQTYWPAISHTLQNAAIYNEDPVGLLAASLTSNDTDDAFYLLTVPNRETFAACVPLLKSIKCAKYLIIAKPADARDCLHEIPWTIGKYFPEDESVLFLANYRMAKEVTSREFTRKAVTTVPFTLAYQWWRGQIVVRHGPSNALWHLFLKRDGHVEDFQLQQDPLTAESVAAVRREIKTDAPDELLFLEGDVPPGMKLGNTDLNPTKDTPSTIKIIAQGEAKFMEDSPLFKKVEFKGKDLPPGLKGQFVIFAEQGSSDMFFMRRVEGGPGSPIDKELEAEPASVEKQERYETVEFADGTKMSDVQVWDPEDMSDSDDKTHDRERLRPPAIYRPMKPAPRDSTSFRSNELPRIFTDFATEGLLQAGIFVEPKYNGWRTELQKTADGEILIISEDIFGGKGLPANYVNYWPSVKAELASIPGPFIIDAEFTAVNEQGTPIPRRELASYRSRNEVPDEGVRLKVFDVFYTPNGNVMTQPYVERRKLLAALLESAGTSLKHITTSPFRLVNNRKELLAAFRWAKTVPSSEGAMLKASQHTATLNENDLIAKVKAIREVKGIIYERHPVKDSPGVYNFFYAIGPVDDVDAWKDVVEVGRELYVPMGKTFNVKLDADVGDVIRIEVTEILLDRSIPYEHQIHGFTPTVIDKTDEEPSSIAEVMAMLDPGELKKSPASVRNAIAKALASTDLEMTVVSKKQEERYVKGIVLVPDQPDAHGDVYDTDTVRDAAHHFMEHSEALGKQHLIALSKSKIKILECYLADADCHIGSRFVKQGTWLLAARVLDDILWAAIKDGRFTGWSMEGTALAEHLL